MHRTGAIGHRQDQRRLIITRYATGMVADDRESGAVQRIILNTAGHDLDLIALERAVAGDTGGMGLDRSEPGTLGIA